MSQERLSAMNQEMGELAPTVEALIRLQVGSSTCGGALLLQSGRNVGQWPADMLSILFMPGTTDCATSAGPCVQSAVPL